MLYEHAPTPLWVIDFSDVYSFLKRKREEGITDIHSYLSTCSEEELKDSFNFHIRGANQAALNLFKAKSAEELEARKYELSGQDATALHIESLTCIWEGKSHYHQIGKQYDLEGNLMIVEVDWTILSDDEDLLKKVVISFEDVTEREKATEQLRQSEAKFRSLFEYSADGLMLIDEELKIVMVNKTLQELTGYDAEWLIGKDVEEFHRQYKQKIGRGDFEKTNMEALRRFVGGIGDDKVELEYSFFDEKHKLRSQRTTVFQVQSGDKKYFVASLTDKTAEYVAMKASEIVYQVTHTVNTDVSMEELYKVIHEALGTLMDVTNFYIALYDSAKNLITFPYLVDEMDEDSSPLEATNPNSLTVQIIREGKSLLLQKEAIFERTRTQGMVGKQSLNFLGAPLIAEGKVIGAICLQSYRYGDLYGEEDRKLLVSISDQIAFALKKKQSDERISILMQAVEQAGDGIIIFNPDGTIKYVNNIFERISSYRRIELLEKPYESLPFDIESRRGMQNSWVRVRSAQPWRGKVDMMRKDGQKVTLDMVVKPVIDDQGKLSSIIASCKDVTYELVKEEQQKRTQRLEAIGRLTGGIAHDFNNILSAIIGYTELASDDLDPDSETAESLMEVLRSAGRAKEMIAHLLAFSRQEESKTEVIELSEHVRESVRFLRSYLPRTIKINESYTQEPSTVIAVPGQIHQIVINLGTNAMHAMCKDDSRIDVSVEPISFSSKDMLSFPELDKCQYLKIVVSDNGCGIDPAVADHIFDPYFTTKGATEGTGLGLSVVHSIVQSHKGAIRVNSEVGTGTTFTVYLPLYAPDGWHQGNQEIEEPIEVSGKESILFVDDEAALVSVFRQGLMRYGYKVEGFTDPRKALEHFKKNYEKFDMVVTDTTMPHLNGVEFSQQVLEIKPDIPVIICTGFTTLISVDDARSKGIKDFIMKPFKIRSIATRIREIFDEIKANES